MTTLPTLDLTSLASVTGGKTIGTSGGSSASNSALTTQLTGIQDSIKDLAKPQQQSGLFSNPTNTMLFAMLAMNRPAPASNVVVVQRRGW